LSDLDYNSICISDCTAVTERIVGDWTGKHLERSIHDLVEVLSYYFPREYAGGGGKQRNLS
jgi:hypothetical protein